MPNWLAFTLNKTSEKVVLPGDNLPDIKFTDINDSTVRLKDLRGKVVVLDYWSTSCGSCYKKFPEFEKLYESFKNNEHIRIYAVNLALKNETDEQIKEKTKALGYSFPNLFTTFENRNDIKNTFQFNTVPTLIIIDKNGRVYYRGNLIMSRLVVVNNAYEMINKLLKKDENKLNPK